MGRVLITNSIYLLVVSLLRVSISFWVSFKYLYFLKDFSISFKLCHLLAQNCSYCSPSLFAFGQFLESWDGCFWWLFLSLICPFMGGVFAKFLAPPFQGAHLSLLFWYHLLISQWSRLCVDDPVRHWCFYSNDNSCERFFLVTLISKASPPPCHVFIIISVSFILSQHSSLSEFILLIQSFSLLFTACFSLRAHLQLSCKNVSAMEANAVRDGICDCLAHRGPWQTSVDEWVNEGIRKGRIIAGDKTSDLGTWFSSPPCFLPKL